MVESLPAGAGDMGSCPGLEESHMLRRLNQEEIENMNRPITNTEIETVIKNFPTKAKDQMASQVNSIKHLENS